MDIFDVIIIGAGPAGLSAAIYAVRANLKVLVISKTIGGEAVFSNNIENYLGFTPLKGIDLVNKFREDVERFEDKGLTLKEGEQVIDISGVFPNFKVKTKEGVVYKSKTVIIASGRVPRMLGVPGEKEYLGKGVAVCATCDGPFYKDKDIVIVGGGNSALDTASTLIKVARSVTIVNNTADVVGDGVLLQNVKNASNVKIINNAQAIEIVGDKFVTGIKIKDQQTNQETLLPTQGIFVEIGWIPAVEFDRITRKNEKNEIMVDEGGATSETGIWASGDVNSQWGDQIIIAAGKGAKAALAVTKFLSKTSH